MIDIKSGGIMRFRHVLSVLLATAAIVIGLAAAPANAANGQIGTRPSTRTLGIAPAAAADCVNGANGFVDIPFNKVGSNARSFSLGFGVTVHLDFGPVNGVQSGWARIDGSTLVGDQVWMDWTTNGGSSWIQCGPFSVQGTDLPNTSAAKHTSPSTLWLFRACGRLAGGGPIHCTGWL